MCERYFTEFRQVFNFVDKSGRGKVNISDLVTVVGNRDSQHDVEYMTSEFDLHGARAEQVFEAGVHRLNELLSFEQGRGRSRSWTSWW